MIERYSDHAANERTYLAWLRTGLAIIAFGFLIERFDLLLHNLNKAIGKLDPEHLTGSGRDLGLCLVAIGLGIMGLATWRFMKTYSAIAEQDIHPYRTKTVIGLGTLLILIGLVVLFYVSRLMFMAG